MPLEHDIERIMQRAVGFAAAALPPAAAPWAPVLEEGVLLLARQVARWAREGVQAPEALRRLRDADAALRAVHSSAEEIVGGPT